MFFWTLFWDVVKLLGNSLIFLGLAFKTLLGGTQAALSLKLVFPHSWGVKWRMLPSASGVMYFSACGNGHCGRPSFPGLGRFSHTLWSVFRWRREGPPLAGVGTCSLFSSSGTLPCDMAGLCPGTPRHVSQCRRPRGSSWASPWVGATGQCTSFPSARGYYTSWPCV